MNSSALMVDFPTLLSVDLWDGNKRVYKHSDHIRVFGGDGTLLRAITQFRHFNLPFFGSAAGTVNFLMNNSGEEPSKDATYKTFDLIKVKITYNRDAERGMDGYLPGGIVTEEFQAFNDICIGGDMNSWIDFNITEKDDMFGKFKGGGVIISTPQGSTGINKNNYGAILSLDSTLWSITGDKTNRKIKYVIEPRDVVIDVSSRSTITVWVDGSNHIIEGVSQVEISKGDSVTLIFNDYLKFKQKRQM